MKSRRSAMITTILGLTILAFALMTVWRTTSVEARSLCGPAGAQTLFVREGTRIFSVGGNRPGSFVCEGASDSQVKLGKGLVKAPFSIANPWAAGIEARGEGQDTAAVNVTAANVRSREHVTCQIGIANRPGQLPRVSQLRAARDGKVAVSAQVPLGEGPELGLCSKSGLSILASGTEFAPPSVELQGQVLSWSQGGQRHSMRI
jgi:hypothetical protein